MELLFSHHHAGGCLQSRSQGAAMARQARPPCAVLAQALRDQHLPVGQGRSHADV